MPGYEPDIKLYANHGGEDPSDSRRMAFGLFCHEARTLHKEPVKGSRLITPCQVNMVAIPSKQMKSHGTHAFRFVGFIR